MQTIITFPVADQYAEDLAAIEAHTAGARILKDYRTMTGAQLLFAISRDGHYLNYVYGSGYHRLSVTDDKGEAIRLLELLQEVRGIASEDVA